MGDAQRIFAQALAHSVTMHNPPAALCARAAGAQLEAARTAPGARAYAALAPVADRTPARGADTRAGQRTLAEGAELEAARAGHAASPGEALAPVADDAPVRDVDALKIKKGHMTRTQFDAMLAGIKQSARAKRDESHRKKRMETYVGRIHERTEELRAEADATSAPPVGAPDRDDDPVTLRDAATTRMNEGKFQRVLRMRLLDGSSDRYEMRKKQATRLSDVTTLQPIVEETTAQLERHIAVLNTTDSHAEQVFICCGGGGVSRTGVVHRSLGGVSKAKNDCIECIPASCAQRATFLI